MDQRIAIIDGVRTPMEKAGGRLKNITADDLAVMAVKEVLYRTGIGPEEIDEVILGNVAQPATAANISRVVALKAGLPVSIPAYTVHRNCASGMESITTAANKILAGEASVIIAGGTESMSNIPYLFNSRMAGFFGSLAKAKSIYEKLSIFISFRPSFLKPDIGVIQGLTDPVSGLIMGSTAEVLAREFHITRSAQDEFALLSHHRAVSSIKAGKLNDEIVPFPIPPDYRTVLTADGGPRENQTIKALANLKPYFDRHNGTVTVGNSCQLTDGAAAVIVMSEKNAKDRGITPLGYLREYAYASLEPERMGLGPAYAVSRLMDKIRINMRDFDVIEINEAFAAQIIANEIAFSSKEFAAKFLGRTKELGELRRDIFNVDGGAIALGHPVGMTGTRLVIHVLKELNRMKKNTGLATLCVGGGQGAALLLEVS
jgi:acetyl-CoA C-acetyltransferase/acetyl-CoA acyltransferase